MRLIGPSKGGGVGWEGTWGRRRGMWGGWGEQGVDDWERGADERQMVGWADEGQKRSKRADERTSGMGRIGGGWEVDGQMGSKREANGQTASSRPHHVSLSAFSKNYL